MKQRLLALALISVLAACGGQTNSSAPAQSAAASGAQPVANSSVQTTVDTSALDPILAEPKVGDLYAAKVSAFSKEGFEEHGVAYGLMKVVDVQADTITVITEDAAWPEADGARKDLNGDLSDITWDESERIEVKRADLPRMVADGRIVETRRLDK
ncbi:hypothetical protein A7P89_11620 [Eikenella corrodens]|uniref:Uncharacterized protein n=1 Tax=Eikenella corrodens TaxID=539 RepID=A0A1A9RKG9_EIKCO|nr:hypothetical protein [Eikenella corrodens]OAM19726.1 hypothetical protein A7P89_11620 [Eikenella corrodens]